MATADTGRHDPLALGIDGGGSKCAAVLARLTPAGDVGIEIIGRGRGGPANPRVAGHDLGAGLDHRGDRRGVCRCRARAAAGRGRLPRARGRGAAPRIAMPCSHGRPRRASPAAWPWCPTACCRSQTPPPSPGAWCSSPAPDRWRLAWPARACRLTPEAGVDRCGGWGPLLGDEGSGHAIGLVALKAAMRAADGRGPRTILEAALLRRFAADRAPDLVACIHGPGVGRREIADAAREVLAAADVGDAVAAAILTGAAVDLAAHVRTLADRNAFAAGVYPAAAHRRTADRQLDTPAARDRIARRERPRAGRGDGGDRSRRCRRAVRGGNGHRGVSPHCLGRGRAAVTCRGRASSSLRGPRASRATAGEIGAVVLERQRLEASGRARASPGRRRCTPVSRIESSLRPAAWRSRRPWRRSSSAGSRCRAPRGPSPPRGAASPSSPTEASSWR